MAVQACLIAGATEFAAGIDGKWKHYSGVWTLQIGKEKKRESPCVELEAQD